LAVIRSRSRSGRVLGFSVWLRCEPDLGDVEDRGGGPLLAAADDRDVGSRDCGVEAAVVAVG